MFNDNTNTQTSSNLTDRQEMFLDYLLNDPEVDGDPKRAGAKVGFEPSYIPNLVRNLSDEILKRSNEKLALTAPKAVNRLIEAMDEDGTVPKGDIRLKAVESILDRIGLSKKQEMSVSIESESPIFFIPGKTSVEE